MTLTGRIKELINRGGEKISPIEVALLALLPINCCLQVPASSSAASQHQGTAALMLQGTDDLSSIVQL